MKKMIAAFAVTLTLLTSGSAYATDAGVIAAAQKRAARRLHAAILEQGKSCPTITKILSRGRTDETPPTAILAIACSDGSTYMALVDAQSLPLYISPCSVMEPLAQMKCFP